MFVLFGEGLPFDCASFKCMLIPFCQQNQYYRYCRYIMASIFLKEKTLILSFE